MTTIRVILGNTFVVAGALVTGRTGPSTSTVHRIARETGISTAAFLSSRTGMAAAIDRIQRHATFLVGRALVARRTMYPAAAIGRVLRYAAIATRTHIPGRAGRSIPAIGIAQRHALVSRHAGLTGMAPIASAIGDTLRDASEARAKTSGAATLRSATGLPKGARPSCIRAIHPVVRHRWNGVCRATINTRIRSVRALAHDPASAAYLGAAGGALKDLRRCAREADEPYDDRGDCCSEHSAHQVSVITLLAKTDSPLSMAPAHLNLRYWPWQAAQNRL